jgi:lipopolysaccharide assembly protein A
LLDFTNCLTSLWVKSQEKLVSSYFYKIHLKLRKMRVFKKIILTLFVILIAIFAVQNSQSITIELFNWSVKLPLSVLIILIYILGMTTGGILFSVIKKLALNDETKIKPESNPKT